VSPERPLSASELAMKTVLTDAALQEKDRVLNQRVRVACTSCVACRPASSLCCAVLCCAVLCCAVLCCAVLCCAVLCCAVLCCAVLCCAVLCRGAGVEGAVDPAGPMDDGTEQQEEPASRAVRAARRPHALKGAVRDAPLHGVVPGVSCNTCMEIRFARGRYPSHTATRQKRDNDGIHFFFCCGDPSTTTRPTAGHAGSSSERP
jgi:hypothetical protein